MEQVIVKFLCTSEVIALFMLCYAECLQTFTSPIPLSLSHTTSSKCSNMCCTFVQEKVCRHVFGSYFCYPAGTPSCLVLMLPIATMLYARSICFYVLTTPLKRNALFFSLLLIMEFIIGSIYTKTFHLSNPVISKERTCKCPVNEQVYIQNCVAFFTLNSHMCHMHI